jgi:ACR3 family arsenite efflux pump ArsB
MSYITLQIVLMPFYMYMLVGRVIPIDFSVLARSVGLFLIAPFILAKGREYFFGPFKNVNGEFKLWALVLVILSMFVIPAIFALTQSRATAILVR